MAATSNLDGIAVDGVLGVCDSGGDPQIEVGADGDIATARVGLDVEVVDIEGCLAVVERHVRQWQIHDHARLDHSLAEPGPPAGAPQGQSVAGRGPRRDGDVSVRYGSPGSAELQARRDILLTPQLIADDKDAVADGA